MTTSHDMQILPNGRPASPSQPFRPPADIERTALAWLLQERTERIPPDHARVEWEGKPQTEQVILDCASCDLGVFILSPDTTRPGYVVNLAQLSAAVVSHLHSHHEDAL